MVARVLGVSALSFGLNVPLGHLRAEQEKFSWQWFLAIHASVPAIIMLRKKLLLPKWAVPANVASAVAGQFIGSGTQLDPSQVPGLGALLVDPRSQPAPSPVEAASSSGTGSSD